MAFLVAAGLIYVVVARGDFERGLADLGLIAIGVLYTGLLLPHFYWVRHLTHGPQWITFVIAIGMAGDTGGYFVGHAFGRHKLIPRVSPGKTVEGALGIVACSLLAGAAGKLILLPERSWTEILCLAGVLAIIGQLGDLGESVMKRTFGAKESGWIFPGHGGVLDRIDSLLFPITLVYYYVAR
jgi:phosphatidate cytidylyltransferase